MKYLITSKNVLFMFLVLFAGTSAAQNLDTLFTSYLLTSIELVDKSPGEILITGPGVQRSTNYGVTWDSATFNTETPECYDLSMNQESPNEGYLSTYQGLFKTLDSGFTWFKLPVEGYFYFVNVSPLTPNLVFAQESEDPFIGSWILYKSTNGGSSWDTVDLPRFIVDLQFHPTDSMIAYGWSGPFFKDIYKTTDQGNTWFSILHENSTFQFLALYVDKFQPGVLYTSSNGKIYKTTDDGQNWTEIGAGLRAVLGNSFNIHNFVFDETTTGRFYVGIGTGLFLTENDGETWRRIHDREIYQVVGDNEKPMHLYFITNAERTLIRMLDTFTVTGVNDRSNLLPEVYSLEQNYPNPFNPSTTIKYTIPQKVNSQWSIVNLKVYDVLGNEIATLVDEIEAAGEHSVVFNSDAVNGGISSGIYFYRIIAGGFIETKKMVLLR
ncbi:MAG: T9SS type A sorting domain-containing protein [Ignavibacteriaceae bacterium]|nr:T9SS type A sorting domain-containing protein [Ignavibacteriaceae bacterium]